MPRRCWRRRSSISGNLPSERLRSTWSAPDCRCGSIPDDSASQKCYIGARKRRLPPARSFRVTLMSRFTVHDLAATIDARAASGGEASYTRKLLDRGAEHCAKKLGEEAVETVIAAIENDREHLIGESADLIYHLLVLLKSRGVRLEDVETALARRTSMSGLEEKASRKRD